MENFASKILSKLSLNSPDIDGNKNSDMSKKFSDDLPDGSCFSRVLNVTPQVEINCESVIKKCEYIGSFPVSGDDQNSRTEFVKAQLKQMQHTKRKKRVLLVISLTGIKVCSVDGKSVLMAHALRRISFATCDPENRQFSFLAREPNGHYNLQYCHSFLAADPKAAEAVSACMGRAFRMAYAQQLHTAAPLQLGAVALQSRSPTSPLLQSAASALHDGSTWTDDDASILSSSPRVTTRPCWGKKLIGKTKHNDPLLNQAIELTSRTHSPAPSVSPKSCSRQSAMNNSTAGCSTSSNLDLDLWSPLGGCSSSEENNSPTDLNSCKQIIDKPPLLKNLEVVKESALDGSFNNEFIQLSSGSYINEAPSWENSPTLRISKLNNGMDQLSSIKVKNTFQNNSLSSNSPAPTAPVDEDNLLDTSTDFSSKRSSRSSCDQSMPSSSSSEVANITDQSDISICKNKRISHTGSASSNSSITPPPPPERYDSLYTAVSEERELRGAPWFQAGIPREIALEVLEQEPVGSFMVRESTSKPGCFALSLRVPRDFHQSGIAHYLIMRTSRGYKIKGFTKEFGTLTALITHHSVMPELLPCPLSLSRYNPSFKKHDSEDMVDIDEDPDYNLLSDFRKMLADINV